MIPFLTHPLALLALVSLPTLAAIYILRNRFRRRQVSSLLLWRFQVQSKEGGVKVNRLQLPLLFFLELLALLLLVIAAAGPNWKLPQAARPLIVILDDSLSLRARHGEISARDRARAYLQELYRKQPPPNTRLILAGSEPRLLGKTVRTWAEVEELLAQWQNWAPQSSLADAVALAAEIGKQQANILVLTDHPPEDTGVSNPRLEWHAFGVSDDNVAIVNASRTPYGEEDRCLFEVSNLSSNASTLPLLFQTGTNAPQRTSVQLAPRERQRIIFNIPATTPELHASFAADALPEDNETRLLPPIRKRVRVRVALTHSNLIDLAERTLAATGLRATLSENPELVIQEGESLPTGSNAWSLRWVMPAEATAFTGPYIIDNTHPVAEGLSLPGVIWAGGARTNPPGEIPILLAGNTPLLSVREDALHREHLTLNLNPTLSTVTGTPDWPVLFWNILSWRIAQMPGLKEVNARLGAEVPLKTTGEAVHVTQPDGTVKNFPPNGGLLALETPRPGIYTVAMGGTTNRFAANVLAEEESDLQGCRTGHWGKWGESTEKRLAESSAVWLFGLSALLLLVAHLWLVAGGKGGR